jgi:hypothetical protein
MGMKAVLKPLAHSLMRLPGVARVLRRRAVRRMLAYLPGARYLLAGPQFSPWDRVHPFDRTHGTDTSGFISIDDLAHLENERARAHAHPYGGSQPSIVRSVLARLAPLDSFTFVDLGCGKGRPLLVASEFPFRDIVGVELSAPLARIAQRNAGVIARRFPQRTPIRVAIGDATEFRLPDGNLVVFMYNPFGSEAIAKIVATLNTDLTNERQRTVYVIYYNPVAADRVDASPLLRRHLAATLPYAADELGYGPDTDDPVVVWHGGLGLIPADCEANTRIEVIDSRYRAKLVPP